MEILNEKEVIYHQFDVELSEEEKSLLVEEGKKRILNDNDALFNYAVNSILKEHIEKEKILQKES